MTAVLTVCLWLVTYCSRKDFHLMPICESVLCTNECNYWQELHGVCKCTLEFIACLCIYVCMHMYSMCWLIGNVYTLVLYICIHSLHVYLIITCAWNVRKWPTSRKTPFVYSVLIFTYTLQVIELCCTLISEEKAVALSKCIYQWRELLVLQQVLIGAGHKSYLRTFCLMQAYWV